MKNKELLNICYKFFNRFITADELIEMLDSVNIQKLSKKEQKEFENLHNEIKTIADNTPNKVDDYVINRKNKINSLIKKVEQIPLDDQNSNFLNKQITNLKKDCNKVVDSHERWFAIADCISKNDYFNTCFDNLTDYELLEFISQNIQAPFPPNLKQEEFERLVKVGIENDEREWLWRLAFNYENSDFNFDLIADYFIEKKDGYYIAELISAVGFCLNIDNIIEKINDKDLIEDLVNRKGVIVHYVSEEQFEKLKSKL